MAQFVYSKCTGRQGLPPKNKIIQDISLSFFLAAKIASRPERRKSTASGIMAGVDTGSKAKTADAWHQDRFNLPQEPELDLRARPSATSLKKP